MESTSCSSIVSGSIAGAALVLALAGPAAGQVTSLVSIDPGGQLPNDDAYDPVISVDGRYVGFQWYANFSEADIFLSDRVTGALEHISVDSNEVPGNSYSYGPALSLDVRYVAFSSYATNLVPGDNNGPYPKGHDVFVRDRQSGTTERVSIASSGQEGNGDSYHAAISADGRYVAFSSFADNLVPGDTNGTSDVFVRDRASGTTERVSVDSSGGEADGGTLCSSISADGRFVVFFGDASNLVAGDTNGSADVFVRDRASGTTQRVSIDSSGAEGDGGSGGGSISPDGRYVAFQSAAGNLVPGDTNGVVDVFLHDRGSGTTERLSVDSAGAQADGESSQAALTPDGRTATFQSKAGNLVAGDTNGFWDVFVRDRQLGTTELVSVDSSGAQGTADSGIRGPWISKDGRYVAFDSQAKLTPNASGWHDVYVRDRGPQRPSVYCTSGTTASGCNASISASGTPSASAPSGFDVLVTSVEGSKQGILFWGLAPAALPWGAGTSWLCVAAPTTRTGAQPSGGAPGACDGTLSLDYNAWMTAQPAKAPDAGTTVYMQGWFRDPPSPKTTSLSDALSFTVCP
jgi:Tol biopolymer transport system component